MISPLPLLTLTLLQLSLSQPAQVSDHPAPTDLELSCTCCCQSSQILSHHSHLSVSALVTRMRGISQYAVLDANGRGNFRTPTLRNPQPISMSMSTSPRELMCKIWMESIQPLRICACVKNTFCVDFFISISMISVCLSVSLSRLQVTVFWRF